MQGKIKIDKNIAVNRTESLTPEHTTCKKPSPMKKKAKTVGKSAQEVAMADMLEEGFSDATDLEDLLLED